MKMKCFRLVAIIAVLSAIGFGSAAHAQNRLYNGDLELTPADVYYDGFDPSVAGDVPGWELFLGDADGSYVLVNNDGLNTDVDMGIGPSGGGLQTATSYRPPVVPATSYTASVTYDNYFSASGAAYFIDWFDGLGGSLGSVGGALGDANGPFDYAPYTQLLSVTGVAPAGAASAGVRFTSGNPGYAGLAADNFSFRVPEPTSFAMMALASAALFGAVRRERRP